MPVVPIDRGLLDIVTGRLVVAPAEEYLVLPPLDASFAIGSWDVKSLMLDGKDEDGRVAAHVFTSREASLAIGGWDVVDTAGLRLQLPTTELLVGDADREATLGRLVCSDPSARRNFFTPTLSRSRYYEAPEQDLPRLPDSATASSLTPEAEARAFYAGTNRSVWFTHDRRTPPAYPELRVRRSQEGAVVQMVIDMLPAADRGELRVVSDSWAEQVDTPGGALRRQLPRETAQSSDLAAAFVADVADFQGTLTRLGRAHLSGELAVYDPRTLKTLDLGVSVPAADYPAYLVYGDFADLLLVRLGSERPTRWHEWADETGTEYIPIDTGCYMLSSGQLLHAAQSDAGVKAHIHVASHHGVPHVVEDFGSRLGGAIVNGDLGGDVPAWCYIGIDSKERVTAIAVALVTDYVLGNEPADKDGQLLDEVAARLEGSSTEDDRCCWDSIQEAKAANNGVLTREARASLYNLAHTVGLRQP